MRITSSAVLLVSLLTAGRLIGQTPATEFWFDDGRPLAKAALQLERQFGWIITYEEPPYHFAADIRDVTAIVRKDKSPAKVLVPNGTPFGLSLDESTRGQTPDPKAVLHALVQAYATSGNPGAFRVVAAPPMFHLAPVAMRDVRGLTMAHSAVLDTPISLPAGRMSLFLVIKEIASAITKATGVTVIPGMMPLNFMIQTEVEAGATNLPARSVLRRILLESGRSLSWQFFSSPTTGQYFLNIHSVSQTASARAR
jgi:hypothetical protein